MPKPTTHVGIKFALPGQDATKAAIGGQVVEFKAAAALLVGDVVYYSASDTVNKDAAVLTVAPAFIGIVVGGKATNGEVAESSADLGKTAAAAANDSVLVQITGIAWTTATAAPAVGAPVIPGATAGKVVSGTTAGQVIGVALDNATSLRIKISHR